MISSFLCHLSVLIGLTYRRRTFAQALLDTTDAVRSNTIIKALLTATILCLHGIKLFDHIRLILLFSN